MIAYSLYFKIFCWNPYNTTLLECHVFFWTFINLYFKYLSVYKTGTIHNLMHNLIKFQSPDQGSFLAFRLIASSFIGARIALHYQCQLVLCEARWSGARSQHCGADPLPSVVCAALFPDLLGSISSLVSLGTVFSSLTSGHLSRIV